MNNKYTIKVNNEEECYDIIDTVETVGTEEGETDSVLVAKVFDSQDATLIVALLNQFRRHI